MLVGLGVVMMVVEKMVCMVMVVVEVVVVEVVVIEMIAETEVYMVMMMDKLVVIHDGTWCMMVLALAVVWVMVAAVM